MSAATRRIGLLCCARAASGQATAEPTIPLMKSRRRIARSKAQDHARMRLQQEFPIGETGFRRSLAQQQFKTAHVSYGSRVDGALARTF